jgi:perosamine synthetase
MVTTDNSHFADTMRKFRNHGISSGARERQALGQWHYEMVLLGYNYRLTDIACALGLRQLGKLESNLKRRRQIAARYVDGMTGLAGLVLPTVKECVSPAWHLYPVRLDPASLSANRSEIFQALRAENIGVNVHYIPVHLHPYYRENFGYQAGDFPIAEAAYECLISLPMFHGMSDRDVSDVIVAVRKVMTEYAK